jgi:hypothetical protein
MLAFIALSAALSLKASAEGKSTLQQAFEQSSAEPGAVPSVAPAAKKASAASAAPPAAPAAAPAAPVAKRATENVVAPQANEDVMVGDDSDAMPPPPSTEDEAPALPEAAEPAQVPASPEVAANSEGPATSAIFVERKHTVVPANTLWDLSAYFYSDPWKWPRIYDANKDRIKDPHWIFPGQVFIIPGFGEVMTTTKPGAAPPPAPAPAPVPAAEPEPVPVPTAPVQTAKVSEELSSSMGDADIGRLSEKLPLGDIGYAGTEPKVNLLPKGWKADGIVRSKGDFELLTTVGDVIEYKSAHRAPAPGTQLIVLRPGETRKNGQVADPIAVVRVISSDGRKVKAQVLKEKEAVQEGDWVKLMGGGAQ